MRRLMLPSSAPCKLQLPTSEVVKIWKAQRGHRPPSLPLHCEDVARRPDVSECDKCLRINLELQRPMSAHFWLVDTHFPNISISSAPHPEKKNTNSAKVMIRKTCDGFVTAEKLPVTTLPHNYEGPRPCTCERISLLHTSNATEKKRHAGDSYLFLKYWDMLTFTIRRIRGLQKHILLLCQCLTTHITPI